MARIYQPQGEGPFPVLLDVHAAPGMIRTARRMRRVDERLAASGILVVAIDVRLARRLHTPAHGRRELWHPLAEGEGPR